MVALVAVRATIGDDRKGKLVVVRATTKRVVRNVVRVG
jgi:hypothetical protein